MRNSKHSGQRGRRSLTTKRPQRTTRKSAISKATTAAEIGAFWDTQDFTDFESRCPDVTDQVKVNIRRVRHYVSIDPTLLRRAVGAARSRGVPTEQLINLWVKQGVQRALAAGKR